MVDPNKRKNSLPKNRLLNKKALFHAQLQWWMNRDETPAHSFWIFQVVLCFEMQMVRS